VDRPVSVRPMMAPRPSSRQDSRWTSPRASIRFTWWVSRLVDQQPLGQIPGTPASVLPFGHRRENVVVGVGELAVAGEVARQAERTAVLRSPRVLSLFRPPDPLVAALDARLPKGDRDLQRQLVDLRAAQDYRYDLRPHR